MNIYNSSLCDFINGLSILVYTQLSRFFSYRLSMSEIGITDFFVLELIDFSTTNNINKVVEVYKTSWKMESQYGNDIDLYIECEDGLFSYYALQAKVMSYNGAYKDLKNKKAPQWGKLLEHESKFNSKTYYLFYNGDPNIRPYNGQITTNDCKGTPDITELGMGIVETSVVKNVIESNKFQSGQIYLHDFLPFNMASIRKLFCCDCDQGLKRFTYDQIHKGAPYQLIKKIKEKDKADNEIGAEKEMIFSSEKTLGLAPTRIIIKKRI